MRLLAALRDEPKAAVVGATAPEAREQPHGEGPRPAGGERLPEEEGRVGKVRHFAEEGGSRKGGQRRCPEDGRRADDGEEEGLDGAEVPLREVPGLGQSQQAAIEEAVQGGVVQLTAEDGHGRVHLRANLDTRAASPLRDQGRRHFRARAGGQRRGRVAPAVVAAGVVGVRGPADLQELGPAGRQLLQLRQTRAGCGGGGVDRPRRGRAAGSRDEVDQASLGRRRRLVS